MFKLFILLVALAASPLSANDGFTFSKAEFVSAHDGDTITVTLPELHPLFGFKIPVRIAHIDTPEINSLDKCEKEAAIVARDVTLKLLSEAKEVTLKSARREKYFRILADVYADDVLVSDVLLKKGLALPYEGETKQKKSWCKAIKK